MKVYISADIEGVAGIAAAAEASPAMPDYQPFRAQMAAEVMAACDGAFAAGASAITVKDAHNAGRNLLPSDFVVPENKDFRLIRGWSGHPFCMVQDVDESYAAAIFVGYHCGAGQPGNPLAHTLTGRRFARVELNGTAASELRLYAYAAALVGVPVVCVSGDRTVCDEAEALIPGVLTVSTIEGRGPSVISITPAEAVRRIRDAVERALRSKIAPVTVPREFHLRIVFGLAADAYARSFYPGATLVNERELVMETSDYLQILTFLLFAAHYQ